MSQNASLASIASLMPSRARHHISLHIRKKSLPQEEATRLHSFLPIFSIFTIPFHKKSFFSVCEAREEEEEIGAVDVWVSEKESAGESEMANNQ